MDELTNLFLLRELNKKDPTTEIKRIIEGFKEIKKAEELDDLRRAIETGNTTRADEIMEKYEEEEKKERKLARYRKILSGGEKLGKDN